MACVIVGGPRAWTGKRDADGHREYKLTYLVKCAVTDGPANVMQTPGLPAFGQPWLVDGDVDVWAFCTLEREPKPLGKDGDAAGDPTHWWEVVCTFSTKPQGKRCQEAQIDDPLLQPQKVSGSSSNQTIEATTDRFGAPLVNSAWEQIRGKNVEFDDGRDTVVVEQNVPDLEYALCVSMKNTVNQYPLWGYPARCVKLSSFRWTRNYYGTCEVYYTRTFEFQVNEDTWDRDLLDEGTKALNGHWEGKAWVLDNIVGPDGFDYGPPDPANPGDFVRVQDKNGNLIKVVLNGYGVPYDPEMITTGTADDQPGVTHVEYYPESDFLLLGIPITF